MVSKKSRAVVRQTKHRRLRNNLAGTAERPRLAVFRSNNHMYAQIIDDTVGNTLVSASTLDKEVKADLEKTNNVDEKVMTEEERQAAMEASTNYYKNSDKPGSLASKAAMVAKYNEKSKK